MSLLFFEHQGNGLLRAKGVVILDTGHHLTSRPTDIKVKIQTVKNIRIKGVCIHVYKQLKCITFRFCCINRIPSSILKQYGS
jgi:hypothetical protein